VPFRALPGLVAAALLLAAASAGARPLRVVCADGEACDADLSCDGSCTYSFCEAACPAPPCAPAFRPCDGHPAEARRVTVPLRRGGRKAARRAVRVGRSRFVLRCTPSPFEVCKPALATGCRFDLPETECAAHEGDFEARGLLGLPACHCRTRDAGRPCARDTQCQGMCVAPLDEPGRAACTAHLVEFGCFVVLDARGEPAALCVD
jgi:hypothetical protein